MLGGRLRLSHQANNPEAIPTTDALSSRLRKLSAKGIIIRDILLNYDFAKWS